MNEFRQEVEAAEIELIHDIQNEVALLERLVKPKRKRNALKSISEIAT